MLDHIYQSILKRNHIEQYILVTGDGHFHSVVAYLRTFLDKIVGVFAVMGSFSEQLKNSATWYVDKARESGR
ncbi:MAG: NYN domain-containing protein [Synergistaceae bacterium]|nr:NYN domain-containing protein [Synergistaceae bacterium]